MVTHKSHVHVLSPPPPRGAGRVQKSIVLGLAGLATTGWQVANEATQGFCSVMACQLASVQGEACMLRIGTTLHDKGEMHT